MKAKAIEMLESAVLAGELRYYQQTGSTAYVTQYEDGSMEIVLSAGTNRKILASAKWDDHRGNPAWTIRDGDEEVAVIISTNANGTVIDDGVYYVP